MSQASARPVAKAGRTAPAGRPDKGVRPFLGLIDAVIVESPTEFSFDGAIARDDAIAIWTWMVRDLAADLIAAGIEDNPASVRALESLMPDLITRIRKALAEAATSPVVSRRIKTQLGGDEVWDRLPTVLNALRGRGLLEKAQNFGRAANTMIDEAALVPALQAMPLQDAGVAALLMQVAVGQIAIPSRLTMAAIRIAGAASEAAMQRAGFGPMIDAMFSHAQNQIPPLAQIGTFSDMDLVCRSVDRFNRLMRAVTGYVELSRNGRWTMIASALTKAISERLDPKLRDVAPDLNKALRRRDSNDRLDSDQILSALNGVYLLAAVRDSRDSLALNALFDQVWAQTGQALEIHIERLLQHLRQNPGDGIGSARLDAALKMAEVRFNPEYADTLRRAKDVAERRS